MNTEYYLAEALISHSAGCVATAIEQHGCYGFDTHGRFVPLDEDGNRKALSLVEEFFSQYSYWINFDPDTIAPEYFRGCPSSPIETRCQTPSSDPIWLVGWPVDRTPAFSDEGPKALDKTPRIPPATMNQFWFSEKLNFMNKAAAKYWANADRDDRGTHPDNATVAAWFVNQGFSETLAAKAATIIRPEWAPTGRRPEE